MGGNLVHSREEEVYCCGKYTGINYTHSKRNCCCFFLLWRSMQEVNEVIIPP